jgi:RNA polymerase sigma-70 factor (ECF subfamily)
VSTVCVTDADLVARARRGDSAAFGELVDRHRVAVYRAAFAALGSHADAEDAAQDAFLLAYRRLGGFRGEASFKTWLLTIAWRQAINRRRGLRRDSVGIWDSCGDPATLRDALLLAQSGAYSYDEIAAMLNTPVGTVKWRVSEARRVIKDRLRPCGYINGR